MISRIRLDGYGKSPSDIEQTLYPHADLIEQMLGVNVARGEFVISRQLNEPEGSAFAFEGRLILHPDISEVLRSADDTLSKVLPRPS